MKNPVWDSYWAIRKSMGLEIDPLEKLVLVSIAMNSDNGYGLCTHPSFRVIKNLGFNEETFKSQIEKLVRLGLISGTEDGKWKLNLVNTGINYSITI